MIGRKCQNKRAQGATGLLMAFGAIVLLIMFIFFFSIIQTNYAERKIENVEKKVDNQITLLNYLRTPVDSENNIADLIAKYAQIKDQDSWDKIQTKTKEILNPIFKLNDQTWRVKLNGDTLVVDKVCKGGRKVSQDIFLHDGNTAKVELIICG